MTTGLRRDLGTLESYAALLGILIGAGIFKVTSDAWQLTGPSIILGYFVLAIPVLATSIAYSVFLSTPLGREPGGEYTHISRTFGGYGLGVRWFGRIQVWMCGILFVSLIVLVVPGLFAIKVANYRPFFTHGFAGFAASLAPMFFAYAGFESLAQTAGEVRDSTRRLPRIFITGISATTLIYLLMTAVALGVLPSSRLATSSAPMADAAAQYLPMGAAVLVTLGAIMAVTTSLNATFIVPSRVGIMLAEDGLAPQWLGRVSARTGTPIIGLTITAAGALALLLTNQISLALNIAVYALVLLYFIHSLALLLLPRLNRPLFESVTVAIPLGVQRSMAVLSMLSMAALLTLLTLPTIELLLGWSAVGAVLYFASRRIAHRRTAGGIEHAE